MNKQTQQEKNEYWETKFGKKYNLFPADRQLWRLTLKTFFQAAVKQKGHGRGTAKRIGSTENTHYCPKEQA